MKLISIMILCTLLFRGDLMAQDKHKLFYDSELFFQTVEKDQNVNASNLAGELLQTFNNDRFFPVADSEFELFTNGALLVNSDMSDSLETFFHIMTGYKYFDYSRSSQFEERRLKSTHQNNVSKYKQSNTQLYVVEDEVTGKELGDYNFDDNNFTYKLPKGSIAATKLSQHIDSKEVPDNYEDNTYRLSFTPINTPETLKIYPEDISLAEEVSRSGFNIKYIFALTENIDEYKSFWDVSTTGLDLYEGQLYRMGSIGGDWAKWEEYNKLSTAQKIQKFYNFCSANNYSKISPYSRRHFHSARIKLIAIAMESSVLGNALWKAADWYHTVGATNVQDKLNDANRQQTIIELEQLSKIIWELNEKFDIFGPSYIYLNKVQSPNAPIRSYAMTLIDKDAELLKRLNQIKFTDSRLKDLADKYYSGIEMHLELNTNYLNEIKSIGIHGYFELFDGENKYAKNGELTNKFLGDYWKEWFKINSDYFAPVEREFGALIREHYPEHVELATPPMQCTDTYEQTADIGIWLKEVSIQPTVLALYRNIQYPDVPTVKVDVEDGIGDFGNGCKITEIDSQPITSHCDYYRALQNKQKGDVITITYNSHLSSRTRYIQLVVK